jgi:hypothetical protein
MSVIAIPVHKHAIIQEPYLMTRPQRKNSVNGKAMPGSKFGFD